MTDGSNFDLVEVPIPVAGDGEILIKVDYAGVNRADISQVAGAYPPPPGASNILGLEVSGHRVDTGEPVMALLSAGGYARYVAVPEGQVVPVPEGLDLVDAAAIIESLATAWSNLVDVLEVGPGKTVLIQGGSGSLGTIAVQLARELGARVLATAGGQDRCNLTAQLGAIPIDHRGDVAEQVKAVAPDGVDAVLDIMGADIGEILPLVATDGRIAVIAIQGGVSAEINVGRLMVKRISIHGTTLRGRPTAQKEDIVQRAAEFAIPRFVDGRMIPFVAAQFPLKDAKLAFDYVDREHPFGKVVLDVRDV